MSARRRRASVVSWPRRAAAVEADTTKQDVDTKTTANPPVEAPSTAPSTLPPLDVSETVLLQGFGWHSSRVGNWYNIIQNVVPDIKAAGFTHVWLPPPSQSVSREGYLPSELYNLNTPYGSTEELKQLCTALKDAGVRPVADIVINHRSAGKQGPDGRWNQFTCEALSCDANGYVDEYYRDNEDHPGARLDWGPWAITGNDPDFGGRGGADTGDDFGPAPDIDHSNEVVRQGIKDWLSWLHDYVGFEGFRFDYVKGFGALYVQEYVEASIGADAFHVSEFWTDMKYVLVYTSVCLLLVELQVPCQHFTPCMCVSHCVTLRHTTVGPTKGWASTKTQPVRPCATTWTSRALRRSCLTFRSRACSTRRRASASTGASRTRTTKPRASMDGGLNAPACLSTTTTRTTML